MLHRFAAACAIASVAIAAGTISILLLTRWPVANAGILTTAWCFVPFAWGVWAMLAPTNWVPRRLPMWGAMLGLIAGMMAGPVLDLPLRVVGVHGVRWVPIVVGPVFYYLLWLLVRVAYGRLRVPVESARAATGSARQ
jgi:hypothetical protein